MKTIAPWCLLLLLVTTACDDGGATTSKPTASAANPSDSPSATAKGKALPEGTLTVTQARAAVNSNPDSLRDKQVKLNGIVNKIGTQTSGSAVTHYIRMAASSDKGAPTIICDMHKVEPKGMKVGDTVTVEGHGQVKKARTKDNSNGYRVYLRDCKQL